MSPAIIQTAITVYMVFSAINPQATNPIQMIENAEIQEVKAAQAQSPIVESSPTPTSKPAEPLTHTVESGDTLAKIAAKYYGGEEYWVLLFNDNKNIENPAKLNSGMTLVIRRDNIKLEEPNRSLPTPTPTEAIKNENSNEEPAGTNSLLKTEITGGNFDQVYKDAGGRFGVPWQVLLAIHRIETGQRDGPIGSGNGGPQGPMQFVPSTFNSYAIDGNGDGVTDINNAVDAIYTAANYLSQHGSIENGVNSYGRIISQVRDITKSLGYEF